MSRLAAFLVACAALWGTCHAGVAPLDDGALIAACRSTAGPLTLPLSATFERFTQAATGQTAGVWFVKFYAPWCEHCKNMVPVWQAVGDALEQEVGVGAVDATRNPLLASRFKDLLVKFPQLVLFRDRKMYVFPHDTHPDGETVEKLVHFARKGYKTAFPSTVPAELPFWSRVATQVAGLLENNPSLVLSASVAAMVLLVLSACWESHNDRKRRRQRAEAKKAAAAKAGPGPAAGVDTPSTKTD